MVDSNWLILERIPVRSGVEHIPTLGARVAATRPFARSALLHRAFHECGCGNQPPAAAITTNGRTHPATHASGMSRRNTLQVSRELPSAEQGLEAELREYLLPAGVGPVN
jgi:hypothetical protein